MMSAALPAVNGMSMRTGRAGYCCAVTVNEQASNDNNEMLRNHDIVNLLLLIPA
jgi:hypothetical protein